MRGKMFAFLEAVIGILAGIIGGIALAEFLKWWRND
jgi:hypothetical protein